MTGPFVRVTKADWPDHEYFVNAAHVSRFWQEDEGGAGLLVNGEALFITESVRDFLQLVSRAEAEASVAKKVWKRRTLGRSDKKH